MMDVFVLFCYVFAQLREIVMCTLLESQIVEIGHCLQVIELLSLLATSSNSHKLILSLVSRLILVQYYLTFSSSPSEIP